MQDDLYNPQEGIATAITGRRAGLFSSRVALSSREDGDDDGQFPQSSGPTDEDDTEHERRFTGWVSKNNKKRRIRADKVEGIQPRKKTKHSLPIVAGPSTATTRFQPAPGQLICFGCRQCDKAKIEGVAARLKLYACHNNCGYYWHNHRYCLGRDLFPNVSRDLKCPTTNGRTCPPTVLATIAPAAALTVSESDEEMQDDKTGVSNKLSTSSSAE
jgi:hypothetical protein